jgi:hypothetical protein
MIIFMHEATPARNRCPLRSLDRNRQPDLLIRRKSASSGSPMPLRMRHRADRFGAVLAPYRSHQSELRLLEARSNCGTSFSHSLVGIASPGGPESCYWQARFAIRAVEADQPALLRPQSGQLPLVRSARHPGLGALAARCRSVHRLDRAESRPPAVSAAFDRARRQRRQLRTGQPGLGHAAAASPEPPAAYPEYPSHLSVTGVRC